MATQIACSHVTTATSRVHDRNAGEVSILQRLTEKLIEWQERYHQRYELSLLDDRMLRDIGLTRSDVEVETAKPFWRA